MSGSMWPTVVAASAPPMPASAAAMTYLTWTARRVEVAVHERRGDEGHDRRAGHHAVAHPVRRRALAEERARQDVEAVGRAKRLVLHQQPIQDHGQRQTQQAEEDA